jgi:hypothetical protein
VSRSDFSFSFSAWRLATTSSGGALGGGGDVVVFGTAFL